MRTALEVLVATGIMLTVACATLQEPAPVDQPRGMQEPREVDVSQMEMVEVRKGLWSYEGMWSDWFLDEHVVPILTEYPLAWDVELVSIAGLTEATGNLAQTSWDPDTERFSIYFDGHEMPRRVGMFLDTLWHEYAHAMTWDVPLSGDHHAAWAVCYGELYQRFVEE